MLSIIILSYKNPALLRLCLSSFAKSLSTALDYEIIVVDNETSFETQSVVTDEFQDKFKSVKLVPLKRNCGYTRGVNEGIRAAKGEYVLYCNYDVIVESSTIETIFDYFKNNPDIGLLGPKLINFNGTEQASCFRFYSPLTIICRRIPYIPYAQNILDRFLMKDLDLSKTRVVDWVSGAVFMTSKSAIEKVGILDEKLYHYFSDVDWARRFWENGYKVVYFADAKIFHYHGQASRGRFGALEFIFNRATRWHIKDAIGYFGKYGLRVPSFI
ncbi:MAG: glycosyltransferase family 2 protein [bacterium]|nr:glycosyltransferase family 2 protein [bacterium]